MTDSLRRFDVALSFAGSEREYARAIFEILAANGVQAFLDEAMETESWGRNLPEYLTTIYSKSSTYCVMLISDAYVERAYTRLERRAAFDRMLDERGEYLLPVRVDDSWIDGLPTATAYLDLRTSGVLGVSEAIVRKVLGDDAPVRLVIPDYISVPRIPLGTLRSTDLYRYLLELCTNRGVALFGCLIYDDGTAEMRKLLRDQDYWDALDLASGPDFEVFAIRDDKIPTAAPPTIDFLTAASARRSMARQRYHSRLLDEYFGEKDTLLAYPSVLLFLTSGSNIHLSRLIPLRRGSVEDVFLTLQTLLSSIAAAVSMWRQAADGSSSALWETVKTRLLDEDYTIYIQKPERRDTKDAIADLMKFVPDE